MAYTINKTDGTVVATITDGTIDTSTSLTLFGKSYSGFGELLNENLVKLLENQTSTASPTAPLKGELWFDANTNQLKVYDGSAFKPTGGAKSQSAEPSSASAGDLWHDSDDDGYGDNSIGTMSIDILVIKADFVAVVFKRPKFWKA